MSHIYELAATHALNWLHAAEDDLIGVPVVTFNGEAGDVRAVKFDEHHGMLFTIDNRKDNSTFHRRWYPVSTIKIKGTKS